MSSDTAVSPERVTRCQWPACPSGFGAAPMAKGWSRLALSALGTELTLILCPFHAMEHIPRLVVQNGKVLAVCTCRAMVPCEWDTAVVALQDWKRHAREINGPEERVMCQECLREFEPLPSGLIRRHNALDVMRGRLLSTLCPGAGIAPRVVGQR